MEDPRVGLDRVSGGSWLKVLGLIWILADSQRSPGRP